MDTNFLQSGVDWTLFFSTFALIFLAELPDKTFAAILLLATRHHPFPVFTGAAVAYVIQTIVALLFGRFIGLLPHQVVHIGAGLLFLGFAAVMWRDRNSHEKRPHLQKVKPRFSQAAWAAFLVIFIGEWGDLTQLATVTLVAKTGRPWIIFWSALSALWVTTAIGVTLGHHAKKIIKPKVLHTIAAVAFAIVGILLLTGVFDK